MTAEFLWYIPNQVEPGHRGDDAIRGHNSLDRLTELALLTERHGWGG
ncbi:alkanesulfonate monooxygenase, partial [Kribbella albertanoniae]